MPTTNTNIITTDNNGMHFIPSGSNFLPLLGLSSIPQTFIISQSATGNQIIHTDELNPYIKIPILSGSNTSNNKDRIEILRYHTASFDISSHPYVSSSLYYTSSITSEGENNTRYLNIPLLTTDNAATVTIKTYNTITSSIYNLQVYSASLSSTDQIKLSFLRSGSFNTPRIHTASIDDNALHIHYITTGSGEINFRESYILNMNSSSFAIKQDPKDRLSTQISVGTGSLSHSGSHENIILYISGGLGGDGRVGFGTKSPKTKFDIKTDGFKVRSRDGVRELIFEEDGRLSAKKYSGTAASESMGGIIQLSYTPGTFEEPIFAKKGETIGTINWVDESLNKLDSAFAFDDIRQKYVTSASVAQITSTIKHASGEGVIGNLEFKVSPVPSGISEYGLKGREGLISFMEINPLLPNAPVLFPYAVSCSSTVYANDLILDYDSLPTSNPSNKGQVYRNGSNQLFISAG